MKVDGDLRFLMENPSAPRDSTNAIKARGGSKPDFLCVRFKLIRRGRRGERAPPIAFSSWFNFYFEEDRRGGK